MDISIRIKALRISKNMTQKELADTVELSLDMIKSIEQGRKLPSLDTLNKFADFFQCTIDYLMGRTDTPNEDRPVSWPEMNKVLYEFVDLANQYNPPLAKRFKEFFDKFPKEDREATKEEHEKYEKILEPLTKSLLKLAQDLDELETPD